MQRGRTLLILSRTQLKHRLRSVTSEAGWFAWFAIALFGGVTAFILVTTGYNFSRILALADIYRPVAFVNDYLLAAFVSLFGIRFLFQKGPRMSVQPFLHLPIPRWKLVGFFQLGSLFSIHNLFPLLFIAPYWSRYVLPRFGPEPAAAWLAVVLLLLVASTYGNIWLRSVFSTNETQFMLLASVVWIILAIDQVLATFVVNDISSFLLSKILLGDLSLLMLVAALTGFALVASTIALARGLREAPPDALDSRTPVPVLDRLEDYGKVGALVLMECRLMARNKRPRHYLIMAFLFSTAYLMLILVNQGAFDPVFFGAVIGLFASGGFALNYGQLMFSWESAFFDGLLTRDIDAREMVEAKLILLQISCALLFLVSLPIIAALRSDLLGLHVSFLLYNAGITSLLIMFLAVRNRRAIDIRKGGSFFNYEGFSFAHWLWLIPTAVPPTALMLLMRNRMSTALILIASAGFAGVLLTPVWSRIFAAGLTSRRYLMAQGFRAYAR